MKKTWTTTLFAAGLLMLAGQLLAQSPAELRGLGAITVNVLKAQEDFLASPLMEGRYSSEKGAVLASDYIASMFGVYGIQPAGDAKSYFQNFNLVRYSHPQNEAMEIAFGGNTYMPTPNVDYYIKSRRVLNSFRIDADVVYVGYGVYLPEFCLDNYGKADVKGKVVVLFPYSEEILKSDVFKSKTLTSKQKQDILDNATNEAKRRGAAAVVYVINGSELTNSVPYIGKARNVAEDILALPNDSTSVAPVAFNLSSVFLRGALASVGVSDDKLPAFTAAKAATIKMHIKVKGDVTGGELCKVRNVVGVIPGEDTTRCIVVGAHYDHYGLWGTMLFPGADDNASGTVGVLTMAKAFKESGIKPKVSIVFGLWTCEEKGLWGSTYYSRNPYIAMDKTQLYINYDMIGRSYPKDTLSREVSFFYYEKEPSIKEVTEKTNAELGSILSLRSRPSLGGPGSRSDHGPFSVHGVPFIGWMAAFHEDYHTPNDTPDKIDYKKMQKIVKLGFLNLVRFSTM